ncbi:CobW family GTP-binding protein [Massilia antarctica]|uniref:CobW family GTP-binding protein n=1 Tax=Massilia antarctica TaxID=2765360 RepID=UPI0006BB7687|nr:GTP-binding protein [Massilia sp. H27-R4]MCY0911896.1 GTP-binding protein [Massilia sp. H27-R4]CUI06649.1 Putative metal chaperone, involved in Zn homeostasis, GTPase of COG0523 family [Janthinobacterium sp. CG23_2]CUU30435.1 Putative metal chaperone, involved in Zn homeostasis, GTPase of COG0523 family [Janthinobacterium sp. CG23_2]
MALIPSTILTGFLGAGKTTLLNRILQEDHGLKIAVIENEFGQENIDNEILVQDSSEQIVEMNNGCICCTVRGDLIVALSALAKKREAGELHFDRIIIETTGLANPGPVAQTFFMDEEVGVHYMLDAVLTVVDARHAMTQLDDYEEAQRQVGFADKLLISKTDLVEPAELDALKARLMRINPRAPISQVDFGRAPLAEVLDIRGFNLNDKLEIDPDFLKAEEAHEHEHVHTDACRHEHGHDHDQAHDHHHGHHSDDIAAFVFKSERPFDPAKLDEFLASLVNVFGPRMLRYKGVLLMQGAERKVVFQGVHQMMGSDLGAKWGENEERGSKMVFIGKNLPKDVFVSGLEQCLV